LLWLWKLWLIRVMTKVLPATPEALADAARLLQDGKLVAFPTETVYGLGANALDGKAVAAIFEAKGRPQFNPLITHGASLEMLLPYAKFDERALALADKFWPGPLTFILPKSSECAVSDLVTAGLETIALRVPAHEIALALIKEAGVPIAAPSANKSGELSPTAPHHVLDSLGDKVGLVLAGGATKYGLESTVVDLSGDDVVIVRPGAVTAEDISDLLGVVVTYDLDTKDKPKSPGQLLRHYAPRIPVRLNAVDVEPGEALLAFGSVKFMGVRGGGSAKTMQRDSYYNLSEPGDLLEAAANLFAGLRALDQAGHSRIAVMNIPDTGIGIAINDRLKRAAQSVR
jgi:L-threonylcarbamoyladenylate synthase